MGASFFGGMTNLDGLAKSTTNKLAGAMTQILQSCCRSGHSLFRDQFALSGISAEVFAGGNHDFLGLENDHGIVACRTSRPICIDTCHGHRFIGL